MWHEFPCGCKFQIIGEAADQTPLLDFDPDNIPLDCPEVWHILAEGKTKGIFQLESHLGKKWCKKIKPSSIENMSALGSILRPGALQAISDDGVSMTELFSLRKNGEKEITSVHPIYDEIVKDDYGIMIYQEQLMAIARELAKFVPVLVDKLRKAVGKKNQKELSELGDKFVDGCVKNGVDKELAEKIWTQIKASGRYMFNRSITKDTKVELKDGSSKTIEEIHIGETVNSPYGFVEVTNKYDHGEQEIYEVELENGNKIQCTMQHKFLCSNEEVHPLWYILAANLEIVVK